jgi:hypothetical protein
VSVFRAAKSRAATAAAKWSLPRARSSASRAHRLDITHERFVLIRASERASGLLPTVHRVASLLKRWLAGTLHNGHASAHLDFYLDEFTFRSNRRSSRRRGLLWYRLVQQAVATDPHPYRDLTAAGINHNMP